MSVVLGRLGFVPVIASRVEFFVIAGIVLAVLLVIFAAYFLFFRD